MVDHEDAVPGSPIASRKLRSLVAAAALLMVVAVLWAPFGVHTTPRGDGWIWMDSISSGERWVFPRDPTRPFIFAPWTIAYFLTPDSFVGAHLVLISLLWGSGLALFGILRRLRGIHDGLAFATACVSIIHPASTWKIALDSPVDRHWAIFFFLLAVLILLATWRRPSAPLLIGMWIAQVLSLWTNQAILPLALAVPLLLLWTAKGSASQRELWRGSVLWLVIPLVNALHNVARHYFNVALLGGPAGPIHEGQILALDSGWDAMARSVLLAYRKHLVDAWLESVRLVGADRSMLLAALSGGAAVVVATWALWPRGEGIGRRPARFLVIAGLLGIGLGFALFVPTSLRFTDGRSFIVSSLGAALFVAGLIGVLCGRRVHARTFAIGSMSLLVSLGTVRVLDQHARYRNDARRLDSILAGVIRQAPDVRPGAFFALSYAGRPAEFWRTAGFNLRSNVVEHALRFLYEKRELSAGVINGDPEGFVRYRLTDGGVGRQLPWGEEVSPISYSGALVYRVRRDLKVVLLHEIPQRIRGAGSGSYDPEELIDRNAPLPRRFDLLGE